MNNQLLLGVLLVTLSWGFMGASADVTTTMASNSTSNVTVASNSTSNMTVASNSNSTTSNSTTTTTTASATTSFSVGALQTPISKTKCGSSKLCVAAPSSCDPSTGSGCYFISAQQSDQLYNFELSGETDGYIAAGVSTASNQNGSNQAYICVNNNNSTVNFFTGTINNLLLTLTQMNASNVKGSVSSKKVQCTFAATLDATTRAAGYSLSVSTGTYNSSTGTFGPASFRIFTNQVNLSDPTANATNQINNGAYPVTYQQPLIPALLVTVLMMTFSAL